MPSDDALQLALRSLQVLSVRSRCWSSRQAALMALRAIATADPTLDAGEQLPEPVELAYDDRPDIRWPEDFGNYMGLWSD